MSAAALNEIRNEVKEHIDRADEHVVRMVYDLLETDVNNNWWDNMPESAKIELEESIMQADSGKKFTHDEVKKKHPEWFTK